jgi:hypothetical protein
MLGLSAWIGNHRPCTQFMGGLATGPRGEVESRGDLSDLAATCGTSILSGYYSGIRVDEMIVAVPYFGRQDIADVLL